MTPDTLAAVLEREHREIDAGVEAFLAAQGDGGSGIEALRRTIGALRRHIFLEEEFLFPPLRERGLVAPIFVMLREHGEIWDAMDALEAKLVAPGDSSVADDCRELLALLGRHNAKEEPIIYPQADTVLGAAAGAQLLQLLTAGQIPDGWRCAQARV